MCGIGGTQGTLSFPHLQILKHRGPDAFGEQSTADTHLYHWRLSILDLSEAGRQPMTNEDGSLWLVFNGEIYNFPELRDELLSKGHRFHSHTDSEVLIHLYEEEGVAMLGRLRGMFAFALYDGVREELFLARDPFGIKPLVYAELPQGFAFGSELRLLTSLPQFPREIDQEALALYFRLNYIPAPWTIWTAARKLLPGHYLRVRQGRLIAQEKYAQLQPQPWTGTLAQAEEALRATLRDSVARHLIADVPLGAFLSGGLDSSLIVAMAQEALGEPLNTFTISFPDLAHYDESHYARQVADHLGTHHTEIPVTAATAQETLEAIVDHMDEPFADSSIVPSALVSRVTRAHVKVALSGDGGDELFAGYNKYQGLRLAERMLPLAPLLKPMARLPLPESRGSAWGDRVRQFRKLTRLLERDRTVRTTRSMEVFSGPEVARILNNGSGSEALRTLLNDLYGDADASGLAGLNALLYVDTHFVLPYDMLWKVDTASMYHALEVRVPFIDPQVANLAFSLPDEWKLNGMERKWILQRVAQSYLPESILQRPKWGFGIPIGEWIRGDLKPLFAETLAPAKLAEADLLQPGFVSTLFQEHLSRRQDRFWELWSLFVFERWRRRYLG